MNTLAQNSNITICSLEHFIELCENLGINDSNVEEYDGQFCFIEIGSTLARCQMDAAIGANYEKFDFDGKRFYEEGQFYFKNEHSNVLRLEFDDNIKVGENTKVTLSAHEVKPDFDYNAFNKSGNYPGTISPHPRKRGKWQMNYTGGKGFSVEMAEQAEDFIEANIQKNPEVKFVIHCKEGKSRSAAMGYYIANKLKIDIVKYLQEYERDGVFVNDETGEKLTHRTSQFRIGARDGKFRRMNHRVAGIMDAVRKQRAGEKKGNHYNAYKKIGHYGTLDAREDDVYKALNAYMGDRENPRILNGIKGWTLQNENKQKNSLKLTESDLYYILQQTIKKLL
jgi:ribosomal protein S4E